MGKLKSGAYEILRQRPSANRKEGIAQQTDGIGGTIQQKEILLRGK
jgi:hypothetical protein